MLKYYGADLNFSLDGKTAIVTGGAAGIGYAVADFFLKKGAKVLIYDLNERTEDIAKQLGGNCIGIQGDVLDGERRKKALDTAIQQFGGVDILVNSAGVGLLDQAVSLSEEIWDQTLDVNLKGSFLVAQLVGKYMIEAGTPGCIVNIASQAGVIALDKHVAYCASKGGVIAMTKVLAYEWGKYGIRVNAVSPTVVLTELGKQAWSGEVGEAFKRQMPSERFAETDEIAGVIAFLCSGAAGMITGHNLLIDGGFTIQ